MPLLILAALARLLRGEPRLVAFAEIDEPLQRLILDFGPGQQRQQAELPFWHLQTSGLWEIPERDEVARPGARRASRRDLLAAHAHGGFPEAIDARLRANPPLARRIAREVLATRFEPTVHDALLASVAMPDLSPALDGTTAGRARDPNFRPMILRIYEQRCAVCGYDGRLNLSPLAVDAAHVRPHTEDGPDTEDNGVALCVLHHAVYDRGAITFDERRRVLVSEHVRGTGPIEDMILRHGGREIRPPLRGHSRPAEQHMAWHRENVFRGPARAIG